MCKEQHINVKWEKINKENFNERAGHLSAETIYFKNVLDRFVLFTFNIVLS